METKNQTGLIPERKISGTRSAELYPMSYKYKTGDANHPFATYPIATELHARILDAMDVLVRMKSHHLYDANFSDINSLSFSLDMRVFERDFWFTYETRVSAQLYTFIFIRAIYVTVELVPDSESNFVIQIDVNGVINDEAQGLNRDVDGIAIGRHITCGFPRFNNSTNSDLTSFVGRRLFYGTHNERSQPMDSNRSRMHDTAERLWHDIVDVIDFSGIMLLQPCSLFTDSEIELARQSQYGRSMDYGSEVESNGADHGSDDSSEESDPWLDGSEYI